MSELVRFRTERGDALLVEVEENAHTLERITRDERGVVESGQRLERALAAARPAIRTVVAALTELAPDEHEVEFGMKLNAEAGAFIAKTAVEGHFVVRLKWRRGGAAPAEDPGAAPAEDPGS